MVVFDEAHLISEWGKSFRPSMLEMSEKAYFLKCLKLALSATATANTVSFISGSLGMNDPIIYKSPSNRGNLTFELHKSRGLKVEFTNIFRYVESDFKTIIFCQSKKEVVKIYELLIFLGHKKVEMFTADHTESNLFLLF